MGIKAVLSNRKFKFGSLATIITVVFIAAVIIINIIASILTSSFTLKYDLTTEKMYEVDAGTINFLKDIDDEVTINILSSESTFISSLSGLGAEYAKQLEMLFSKINSTTSKVTIKYIDLTNDPTFGRKYPDESISDGNIIIQGKIRYKYVLVADMYNLETDNYGQPVGIASSKAEQVIMNGIQSAMMDEVPVVSILSGHGEASSADVETLLKENNFETQTVDLLTKEIDQASQFVIINAPSKDYTENDIKKIEKYLDNDGKKGKNLYVTFGAEQPALPNLETFLSEWGIKVSPDLAYETDTNNMIPGMNGLMFVAQYADESYSGGLRDPLAIQMRPLELSESVGTSSRKTSAILNTSTSAVVMPADPPEDWDASKGTKKQLTLIAKSEDMTYEGTDPLVSAVFVSGSDYFTSSQIASYYPVGNQDLVVNMFDSASSKEGTLLSIRSKTAAENVLETTITEFYVVLILCIIIIPIIFIVLAIVVYIRRRHL